MNTKQQLITQTIEQETSRAVKAYDIYKAGLVEQVDNNEFMVKGQYTIKDIDALFTCICPDFEYREITRCKHIIAVELYLLDKVNGA